MGEGEECYAAEFVCDVGGELAEDPVLRGLGEVRDGIGFIRRLRGAQPVVFGALKRWTAVLQNASIVVNNTW